MKDLKKKALLTKAPKPLPSTAWTVFNAERLKNQNVREAGLGPVVKASSAEYKAMTPEQLEVSLTFNRECDSAWADST